MLSKFTFCKQEIAHNGEEALEKFIKANNK